MRCVPVRSMPGYGDDLTELEREQVTYLQSHKNPVFGFESLAIVHSLPVGLLILS